MGKIWFSRLMVLFLILNCPASLSFAQAQKGKMKGPANPYEGFIHAPDFPENLDWLNTGGKSLSIKDFKGKFVLLDFWTYCCINCIHIIPDLKKLEEKYPNELVVIGVHSGKFENEKNTDPIRQAVMRYEIKHPVVNDKNFEVWQSYTVNSWPTLVLINPNGRVIGAQPGEGTFELFDHAISEGIAYFDKKGELKRSPLTFPAEKESDEENRFLSFPGKISADQASKRLAISDSNHNRIVIIDSGGQVLEVIGSGAEGKKDGSFQEAEFHHPQGTFFDGDWLYVADTENHLIRRIDFKAKKVETVLGTGNQSRVFNRPGRGKQVALNSPWDVLIHEGKLYIAMAGSHQIWEADLKDFSAKPFAGSGSEARVDGPADSAALAQPSGLSTDGTRLFFADSEVSSIRFVDFQKRIVQTIIGRDLFEFGDIDGDSGKARLQHALGVLFDEGFLYVADTYNSKVKILDPEKKTSHTFAGTGNHGSKDSDFNFAEFNEPGGLAKLGNKLFLADTNNHLIRALDLETKKVSTLKIKPKEEVSVPSGRKITIEQQEIKSGEIEFVLSAKLPPDFKLNPNAPQSLKLFLDSKKSPLKKQMLKAELPFSLSAPVSSTDKKAVFETYIYFCSKDEKICLFDHFQIEIPLKISERGKSKIDLEVKLQKPV